MNKCYAAFQSCEYESIEARKHCLFQVFVCMLASFVVTTFPLCAAGAAPPASQPVTAAEAIYRNNLAMVNTLLDGLSDDDLLRVGVGYRSRGDYTRAAILHLATLRGKQNDPRIEYELACDFSSWNQQKLGIEYLQKAAEHGYWGYRIIAEDTDVDSLKKDPTFPAILAKIKASFDTEAPKHAPGMTLKAPAGKEPAAGWPVVFFLHGWASNRHDFDDDAAFVATLGYVGVTLDATEAMGPGAYTWSNKTVDPTHTRVQSALKSLTMNVDHKRVYLQGFSQGAMHAARLLAEHPDLYAGAICNSPGSPWLAPNGLANPERTGTIVLSVGSHESAGIINGVDAIESLWKAAKRPVHVIHFNGGHQLPPDSEEIFRTSLEQLTQVK